MFNCRLALLTAILWMGSVMLPLMASASQPTKAQSEQLLETSIDHVVVYQQGAQVERVSEVHIP